MKKIRILSFFFLIAISSSISFGQIKEFDKLEMLYSQKHYKMVYRKSNRLLDKPEYDFSLVPSFYKSMSIFQLAQNEQWLKRHASDFEEARTLMMNVQISAEGSKIITAHLNELIYLKSDLLSWLDELKRDGKEDEYTSYKTTLAGLFDNIPSIDKQGQVSKKASGNSKNEPVASKQRMEVVEFAKKQIGVPYLPGGNDSKGFDCSGFTSYVMNQFGISLPRRAIDQEKNAKKVHLKHAQKGDLVFFDSGSGISHVGMIVSNNGETLEMIHASSSKGVIITDINQSAYWKERLVSFGSYFE